MNDAKYIGLDVHQATITVAVRDSAGKLVIEAIVETKAETILQFLRGVRGSLYVTLKKALASRCMHPTIVRSGLRRSRKPVYVVVRNFITCSSTPWRHCARECDGNS